jgi:hypothetical protein
MSMHPYILICVEYTFVCIRSPGIDQETNIDLYCALPSTGIFFTRHIKKCAVAGITYVEFDYSPITYIEFCSTTPRRKWSYTLCRKHYMVTASEKPFYSEIFALNLNVFSLAP